MNSDGIVPCFLMNGFSVCFADDMICHRLSLVKKCRACIGFAALSSEESRPDPKGGKPNNANSCPFSPLRVL